MRKTGLLIFFFHQKQSKYLHNPLKIVHLAHYFKVAHKREILQEGKPNNICE